MTRAGRTRDLLLTVEYDDSDDTSLLVYATSECDVGFAKRLIPSDSDEPRGRAGKPQVGIEGHQPTVSEKLRPQSHAPKFRRQRMSWKQHFPGAPEEAPALPAPGRSPRLAAARAGASTDRSCLPGQARAGGATDLLQRSGREGGGVPVTSRLLSSHQAAPEPVSRRQFGLVHADYFDRGCRLSPPGAVVGDPCRPGPAQPGCFRLPSWLPWRPDEGVGGPRQVKRGEGVTTLLWPQHTHQAAANGSPDCPSLTDGPCRGQTRPKWAHGAVGGLLASGWGGGQAPHTSDEP